MNSHRLRNSLANLLEIFSYLNMNIDPVEVVYCPEQEWKLQLLGSRVTLESNLNHHYRTFILCTNCCRAVNHTAEMLFYFSRARCVKPHLATRRHQLKRRCVISLSWLELRRSTFLRGLAAASSHWLRMCHSNHSNQTCSSHAAHCAFAITVWHFLNTKLVIGRGSLTISEQVLKTIQQQRN